MSRLRRRNRKRIKVEFRLSTTRAHSLTVCTVSPFPPSPSSLGWIYVTRIAAPPCAPRTLSIRGSAAPRPGGGLVNRRDRNPFPPAHPAPQGMALGGWWRHRHRRCLQDATLKLSKWVLASMKEAAEQVLHLDRQIFDTLMVSSRALVELLRRLCRSAASEMRSKSWSASYSDGCNSSSSSHATVRP